METSPKISIIVPVYKVEKYLCRCLDSIVAQTFTDWECILIDDGSPDNSAKICDEYAEKDGRFRVIHQKNAGVSAARNAGIDAARGEWIGFVDSDDWIEKETYEVAYKKAIEKGVNVVCYGAKFFKNGNFSNVPFKDKGDIFYKFQHYRVYMHSLWNKLIKRELIGGKRLNVKMKTSEDLLFVFDVFTEKEVKIVFMQNLFYCYNKENEFSSKNVVLGESWLNSINQLKINIFNIYENKQIIGKSAKTYFNFINFESVIPYINKLEFFNPNKFIEIYGMWNFCGCNYKMFFQVLFTYLKMDFIVKCILQFKNKVKTLKTN